MKCHLKASFLLRDCLDDPRSCKSAFSQKRLFACLTEPFQKSLKTVPGIGLVTAVVYEGELNLLNWVSDKDAKWRGD